MCNGAHNSYSCDACLQTLESVQRSDEVKYATFRAMMMQVSETEFDESGSAASALLWLKRLFHLVYNMSLLSFRVTTYLENLEMSGILTGKCLGFY